MEEFIKGISNFNDNIIGPIMVAFLLAAGVLLTVRSKFFQLRKFPSVVKHTIGQTFKRGKSKSKSAIPQFEAFSAAIAGTIGTGNIVGVATALVFGGPGAIFWMWVSAFFGMMTKFSENVLGIYYRKKNASGEFVGGPMYYIENGLGKKWKALAIIFAIFTAIASFGFNMTQVNSISGIFKSAFEGSISPDPSKNSLIIGVIVGVIVAILIALVTLGGIKRIGKVASYIVPFMALIFMGLGIIVISINYRAIPESIALIFECAFTPKALFGGGLVYPIIVAMGQGFSRGIYSNEAGLGSSVMAHSSSDVKEPVEQGMWGIFEVFLDTIVICTMMALVYLTTGAYGTPDPNPENLNGLLNGVDLALLAFGKDLGKVGEIMVSIILPLFAFTTILSWSFYGEKVVEYLFGKVGAIIFKVLYIIFIVVGSIAKLELVWNISVTFNVLMAVPNLIALMMLSSTVYAITENYLKRHSKKRKYKVIPMLAYDDDENMILINEINMENNNKETK